MSCGPKAVELSEAEPAELRRLHAGVAWRGSGPCRAHPDRPGLRRTRRGRFAEHRLEGLTDAPRSGAPRTIDDEAVEHLVALTLEEAPSNATHWSTRAMARRTGMSRTAVSRIWQAFGLQPHRAETFKRSSNPAFVEKVRDVVGLVAYFCLRTPNSDH